MVTGEKGLSKEILRGLSSARAEPGWMLQARLAALRHVTDAPMPAGAGELSEINFDDIDHRRFDRRMARANQARPANPGESALSESEHVFNRNNDELRRRGVIFCDMDAAVREYPQLVRQYFATVIATDHNKFAALNTSAWSGGSFIYVPPGVEVEMPLQAYFRTSTERMGQFERNLIIADEGSTVHYIEGCSAPVYTVDPLHAAVVEVVVRPNAHVTYTSIQNWSGNVVNVVTKRAAVEAEGHMKWIDGNIGARLTVQHPEVLLAGPKASGEVLSVAYAGAGQHQNVGARVIHAAPETKSNIVSRCVAADGGRSDFSGVVQVAGDANGCTSFARRDFLAIDDDSICDDQPMTRIDCADAVIDHESTAATVAVQHLFYLMSRGLSEKQAIGTVVNGFVDPMTRTLPMEYAIEWSRLIELQVEGSIG